MASDANLVLAALTTSTTTTGAIAFTALDLKTTPPWLRRANAQLIIHSISAPTAGGVYTPGLQQSSDNTTFTSLGDFAAITATTAVVANIYDLPCSPTQRYLRLNVAQSVTTGTPTLIYECRIMPAGN